MPVSIACTGCGSKLTVRDELLGKRIKCPKCGTAFAATAAAAQAPAVKETRVKDNAGTLGHRIHISGTVIFVTLLVLLLPGGLLFWKLGPGKVRADFNAQLPTMDDSIKDVVDRALQAYLSQHESFDPMHAHSAPKTFDVTYKLGYMPVTMPQKIPFAGLTSEGLMVGQYTMATGEIQADVEIGGMATPNMIVRHGKTIIKVGGHSKNGDVIATINGAPAVIKYPETPEQLRERIKKATGK
jgi:hypothetical protein